MKRKFTILLLIVSFLCVNFGSSVQADDPDFSDDSYWQDFCSLEHDNASDYIKCNMYYEDYKTRLEESIDETKSSIEEYGKLIVAIKTQIDEYNTEIETLEAQIEKLQIEIDDYQTQIDTIYKNIRDRMTSSQTTMHFNSYLSFLMGATSFADIIKRVYIVETMVNKEKSDTDKMSELKEKVIANQEEVKLSLETVEDVKYKAIETQTEYENKQSILSDKIELLQIQQEEAQGKIEANQEALKQLNKVYDAGKFIHPVPNASISGAFGYYAYGVHLGIDYAVGRGTEILAPANGIVLWSYDACTGDGCLGNGCGLVWGGGNQLWLMCQVNNMVYVVKFNHMQYGSVTTEDILYQGDVVGKVGSTGNSTGPHCHIEVFYLGDGSLSDYANRSYDTSFGCGYGSTALNYHVCNSKADAPCRLNPQVVFDNEQWW